jgi:pimeloyl-ACP methyl ester carboxylesterase
MARKRSDFSADKRYETPWGGFSVDDSGGGKPLFLLHGAGRSKKDWDESLKHIHSRRLIRPDFRGHGGSSVPKKKFKPSDLAVDIFQLANQLWLGKFDVAGHGLGGMVALEMLRITPERIGKVALLEGWTRSECRFAFSCEITPKLPEGLAEQIRNLYDDTFIRWAPAIREYLWSSIDRFDGREILETTRMEILEIYGDRSENKPDREKLLIPKRSNISLEWIGGGGHFLPLDSPSEVGRLLNNYFNPDTGDDKRTPPPPASLIDLWGEAGR